MEQLGTDNKQNKQMICIFNLQDKFDLLHDHLNPQNAIQIDHLNNVYVGTLKKIYIISFKRLLDQLDWISHIITLKDMYNKRLFSSTTMNDPITQAFNSENQDRASHVEFIQFAVKDESIPIIHGSLISKRLRALNSSSDLLGFRSFSLHPSIKGTLAVVLNNGDAYIYSQDQSILVNDKMMSIFKIPLQPILQMAYSDQVSLDDNTCILVVSMSKYLYFMCQWNALQQFELGADCVNGTLIVRSEVLGSNFVIHSSVLTITGKIYYIRMTIHKFTVIECRVQSTEVHGCLGLQWSSGQLLLQQRQILYICKLCNLESIEPIRQLNPLSKIIASFNDGQILVTQGAQIYYDHETIQISQLCSVNGAAQSKMSRILVLGGQPDSTLLKKGNLIMIYEQISSPGAIILLYNEIKSNLFNLSDQIYIAKKAMNFDDLLYVQSKELFDHGKLIDLAMVLYDSNIFGSNKKKQYKIEIQHFDTKTKDDSIELRQFILSVLLLYLWSPKDNKELWEYMFNKRYLNYLEKLEESLRIVITKISLGKTTLMRLQMINPLVGEKIKSLQKVLKIDSTQPYKHFNSYESITNYVEMISKINWPQADVHHNICPECSIEVYKEQWEQCLNGHNILRCGITQEILFEQRLMICQNCKLISQKIQGIVPIGLLYQPGICPICFGEQINYI